MEEFQYPYTEYYGVESPCTVPVGQASKVEISGFVKLAEMKTALEDVQEFEIFFGAASVTDKLSLYTHVPVLLEACGHKEKPVAKAASALLTTMYAAHLSCQQVPH